MASAYAGANKKTMSDILCDKLCGTCPWCLGFIAGATEKDWLDTGQAPFTDGWHLAKRGWWVGHDICDYGGTAKVDAERVAELLARWAHGRGVPLFAEAETRGPDIERLGCVMFPHRKESNEVGVVYYSPLTGKKSVEQWIAVPAAVALLLRGIATQGTDAALELIRGANHGDGPPRLGWGLDCDVCGGSGQIQGGYAGGGGFQWNRCGACKGTGHK
jgi:hypothetical protein